MPSSTMLMLTFYVGQVTSKHFYGMIVRPEGWDTDLALILILSVYYFPPPPIKIQTFFSTNLVKYRF